jgi:hypothetical protein
VNKSPPQEKNSCFVEKASLVKLRLKAMRSGVWYRALNRIDRVLVDLTIKVIKTTIQSHSLINQLRSVTTKLESLLESKFSRATREIGFPLACKLSAIAQNWGYKLAQVWSKDLDFAKYLAAMKLNANQNG